MLARNDNSGVVNSLWYGTLAEEQEGKFFVLLHIVLFRKFVPRSKQCVNICNSAYKLAELDLCKDSVVKEH